jgi:hypothetical protein
MSLELSHISKGSEGHICDFALHYVQKTVRYIQFSHLLLAQLTQLFTGKKGKSVLFKDRVCTAQHEHLLFQLCDPITECCVGHNSEFVVRDIQTIQIHCGGNAEILHVTTGRTYSNR